MDHFGYRDGELHAEDVPLAEIARRFGTPCYVYSRATLERHWRAFDDALDGCSHLVCYAVKANGSLAVLDVLARLGSGFDIVSVGELERVLAAGGDPAKVVFSGVGKRADEMRRALEVGIACFNVESESELLLLDRVAREAGKTAAISVRVNPDVDACTHPYIATGLKRNKFGVPVGEALALYRRAASMGSVEVHGIDCHIGSQLTTIEPFVDAVSRVLRLADELAAVGIAVRHLNVGGGLGVRYREEEPPEPHEYAGAIRDVLDGRALLLLVEPGRAIAGNAGVLLTRIEFLKRGADRDFAVVDAGLNDLIRPALYDAWQAIVPVREPRDGVESRVYEVVGPVCESADFLGRERELAVAEGDLLAVRTAGAYGFVMSSNYNARPRAAEVMVDGALMHLARERERVEDLMRGESRLPASVR